jgi:hypothetical protein
MNWYPPDIYLTSLDSPEPNIYKYYGDQNYFFGLEKNNFQFPDAIVNVFNPGQGEKENEIFTESSKFQFEQNFCFWTTRSVGDRKSVGENFTQ